MVGPKHERHALLLGLLVDYRQTGGYVKGQTNRLLIYEIGFSLLSQRRVAYSREAMNASNTRRTNQHIMQEINDSGD